MEKYNGCMYVATGNMECKRVEGFKACLDVRANRYIHDHADAKVKCPKICTDAGYNEFEGNWDNPRSRGDKSKFNVCKCCKK